MDIPQPPADEDTRNIIDRLANFVARNGQDFENMTKQKQRDNPKFQFLFGGEYYGYYTYRVTTEQAILKQQSMRQQQQQQQLPMPQNHMPLQQHNLMGNPLFANTGGPPHPSRFGSPLSHFDRQSGPNTQSGPPPGMGQQQQRFDRSPFMNQQNFDRLDFERPPGATGAGGGNFQNYDRGQLVHSSNFGQQGQGGPTPLMQMQPFDRNPQSGNFERYPGQGGPRFDRPPRLEFNAATRLEFNASPRLEFNAAPRLEFNAAPRLEFNAAPRLEFNAAPRHAMIPQFQGMRPGFDGNSGGGPMRFERPPLGNHEFERLAAPGGLNVDRSYANPSFDPQKLQQIPQATQQQVQPPPLLVNIEALTTQKKSLEEQILQSEKNLSGQQQLLVTQQQAQVEETLRKVQDTEILELAAELNVDINEFGKLLQLVMDSCTKESIANGKAWIFTHTSTRRHYDLLTSYLLRKVTDPASTFPQRLYIIYLVNDTLHHCVRKGADDMQNALEKMVIPMFCFTKYTEGENEENILKLNKLLGLWESKPNYISKPAVEKLTNYTQAWSDYKNELVTKHALLVTQIVTNIQKTFESYQNQHLLFVHHVNQSIKQIEQKIEDALIQQQKQKLQEDEIRLQQEKIRIQQEQIRQQEDQMRQKQEELRQQHIMRNVQQQSLMNPQIQGMGMMQGQIQQNLQGHSQILSGYPLGMGNDSPDPGIPDLSRPPPGFTTQSSIPAPTPEIPRLPYYELPAGLMVPLVKPDDDNYKPLDPSLIRLPPPCPPSDRLIQAIEAFYGPPSHDNPRDSEGWERLGLYEYYKSKNLARKQKEDDIREGRREKSQSPSPIRREQSPSGRSPPRRRYQSKSPSPSNITKRRRSRSRSPKRATRRRRSRSRSRSPSRRSPTPPSFGNLGLGMERERVLDESNKGHQLLKKMGWGGSGLGANEQGIEAPIKGGELRDRVDQYKGVGVSLHDPFESYRKTKGQAFVERMRARADERP